MARSVFDEKLRSKRSVPVRQGGVPAGGRKGLAASEVDTKRSKQAVVKAASHQKTVRGVKNTVKYIGSHGGQEDGRLYDETGNELTQEEAQARVDQWGLIDDRDNLSKAGRDASETDFREMPDSEKYRLRQTSHFIVSLPIDHQAIDDQSLRQFAVDTIEPFREAGHRAIFAVHRHQAKPHVHFVVTSEGNGERLRPNKEFLHDFRDWVVVAGERQGIDLENVRRVEREEVRDRVGEGTDTLKPKSRKSVPLTQSVPVWYSRWGHVVETERAGLDARSVQPESIDTRQLHPASERALDSWTRQSFKEPERARSMYMEMMAEDRRTANWYARNRPEIFGKQTAEPAPFDPKEIRANADVRKEILKRMSDGRAPLQSPTVNQAARALKQAGDRNVFARQNERDMKTIERAGHNRPTPTHHRPNVRTYDKGRSL